MVVGAQTKEIGLRFRRDRTVSYLASRSLPKLGLVVLCRYDLEDP